MDSHWLSHWGKEHRSFTLIGSDQPWQQAQWWSTGGFVIALLASCLPRQSISFLPCLTFTHSSSFNITDKCCNELILTFSIAECIFREGCGSPSWQFSLVLKTEILGISLVVQWLELHIPNAGGLGSIPGQGTRSHVLQLTLCVSQWRPYTLQLKDSTCSN